MSASYQYNNIQDFVGHEIGISNWLNIDQERINGFADATGDHQWIHVDVARARAESPFGTTIAHGFLTLSLLANMLMELGAVPVDVSRAMNIGVNNVRFRKPVCVDQRVRARTTLTLAEPKSDKHMIVVFSCLLEIENESEPAVSGDITVMMYR